MLKTLYGCHMTSTNWPPKRVRNLLREAKHNPASTNAHLSKTIECCIQLRPDVYVIIVGNYCEARVIRPEVGLAVAIQLDYSRNPSEESLLRKKSHQQASSYINYSELSSCTMLFSVVLSHGTRARVSLVPVEPLLQVRQGELVSGLVLAIAGAPSLNSVVGEVNKLTAANVA